MKLMTRYCLTALQLMIKYILVYQINVKILFDSYKINQSMSKYLKLREMNVLIV